MARWRDEARLIVYLKQPASQADLLALEDVVREAPWVEAVEQVSVAQARERFQRAFPSLEDLMAGWNESPLPPSLEVAIDADGHDAMTIDGWIEQLRALPGVELVDDDRDWIGELEAIATLGRTVGLAVGFVLLAAATFTIASVVRLTAYLYQDEISIMRLVGATEVLIRGPFYFEGLLQGLLGALTASAVLRAAHAALLSGDVAEGVVADLLLKNFLSWPQLALLLAIGCLAGVLGAVVSLKGETLSAEET